MADCEYHTTVELPDRAGEFDVVVHGERTPYRAATRLDPEEGGYEVLYLELFAGPSVDGAFTPITMDESEAAAVLGWSVVEQMTVDAAEDADRADDGDRADRAYDEWRDRHIDGGEFDLGGEA